MKNTMGSICKHVAASCKKVSGAGKKMQTHTSRSDHKSTSPPGPSAGTSPTTGGWPSFGIVPLHRKIQRSWSIEKLMRKCACTGSPIVFMITCVFVVNGGKCVYNIDIRDRPPNNHKKAQWLSDVSGT